MAAPPVGGYYPVRSPAVARSMGVSFFAADSIGRWIGQVDRLEKQRAEQTQPDATRGADEEAVREARKRASWHPHPDDPA